MDLEQLFNYLNGFIESEERQHDERYFDCIKRNPV